MRPYIHTPCCQIRPHIETSAPPDAIPCSEIGDNGVITEDVTLTSDLIAYDSPCITIAADSVELDCAGFSINGNGYYEGVVASGVSDVTFLGVGVGGLLDNNFSAGVFLSVGASGVLVSDNGFIGSLRLQSDSSGNVVDGNVKWFFDWC